MTSKGLGLSLSGLCWNLTIVRDGQPGADHFSGGPLSVRLSADLVRNGSTNNGSGGVDQSGPEFSSRDKHALLYIIVVLLFYSTGIVIAIVNYLKREKKEIEEEKAYDDYAAFRSDPDKMARYFRVQRMISYLNKVDEAKEAAALKERLQGRASCPPLIDPSPNDHLQSKIRASARFSVGSDHVVRCPFRHKTSHHVVSEPETEVNDARRHEQGTSIDCCFGEGEAGEDGAEASDRDQSPLATVVSHV